MPSMTERLALLISADVQGAVRGLNEVGKASQKNLGETEKRIDKLGAKFSKVGAGMLAVGGAAAVGLYKTVDAASDLEQAVGGTEAVFKDASSIIDKYAKDAADAAGLSERAFREATTSIGGNLKRMGFSAEDAAKQSTKLTQTAADLAATYGGTTAEAVAALGAAFRGEADPAERFNLNLKASVVAAKAVELGLASSTSSVDEHAKAQAILAVIAEQSADAQGQFAREADSAAGASQRAAAQFENARAELGESLAPIMADVADMAAGLFSRFNDLNQATGGLAGRLAAGATGLTLVGGAALTAVGKMVELNRTLRDSEGNLTRAGRAASSFGKALGFGAAALTAINLLETWADATTNGAASVEKLTSSLLDWMEMGERTGEILEITGSNFEDLGRKIELAGNSNFSIFDSAGIREVMTARKEIDDLDKALAQLFAQDPAKAEDIFNRLSAAARIQGASMDQVKDRFNDYTDAVAGASNEQRISGETGEEGAEGVKKYGDAVRKATNPIEAMRKAIDEVNDAIRAQFDPLFAAQDALIDNQEAQQAVTAAKFEAKVAQDEYNATVKEFGRKSPEAQQAAWRLAEAQQAVDTANRDAQRSALDVSTATAELAGKMRSGEVDIEASRQQIDLWAQQGLITTDQARDMKEELGLVAVVAGELNGQQVLVHLYLEKRKFDMDLAAARFALAETQIAAQLGGANTAGLQVRAHGGPVSAGTPYLVGERGPELMVPSMSGTIVPNHQLGLGGDTYHITINNPVGRPAEESLVSAGRTARYLAGVG